jgi:hypothetical protein
MIGFAIAFLFQAAAGAPAQQAPPPAATQSGEEVTVLGKKEEPKIVCRMEYVTGSRVRKERICTAPPNQAQDTQTNLQRQIDRLGDFVEPPAVFGN